MRMSHSLIRAELLPSRTLVAGAIVALHIAAAYVAVLGPGGNVSGRHPAAHAVLLQSRHDRVGGDLVG